MDLAMRGAPVLMALFLRLACSRHAAAGACRQAAWLRIDSLIATAKDGSHPAPGQGRGARAAAGPSGAEACMPCLPGDAHTIMVEFVATPPPPAQTVIEGCCR